MRKTPKASSPKIKVFIMTAVPIWLGLGTILFVWATASLSKSTSANAQTKRVLGVRTTKSYNMFAAIPDRSTTLTQSVQYSDTREYKLRAFFMSYRAPQGMLDAIPAFIEAADYYELPWTLLPSIACKESGCGRKIPSGSYNPFGWAVYTGQQTGANFASFSDAVWVVAKGLREDYFDRGLDTVPEIETRYTPPSAQGHKHWQKDVMYFMNRLENWPL